MGASGNDKTIVVLSDSLAYYGPQGGLSADDGRIWPNIVGQRLGRRVELFGRIGWTSRDIWWAITQDPRIWAALPHAEVVVLAYCGMDSLPSPLPTALREQIRYLRPNRLRQWVRDGYGWLQPRASKLGWPLALPPRVTVEYLEKVRSAIVQLRPDLPIVLCLIPTHASPYYGNVHSGRVAMTTAMADWARANNVPTVDFYPVTREEFADHPQDMNPDGIHWGFRCHSEIAGVVVDGLTDLLESVPDSPDDRSADKPGGPTR